MDKVQELSGSKITIFLNYFSFPLQCFFLGIHCFEVLRTLDY